MFNPPTEQLLLLFKRSFMIFTVVAIFVSNAGLSQAADDIGKFIQERATDYQKTSSISNKICETPGCIDAASSIIKNMDKSVNPCDNFYQFACGNFIKKSVIPDDKSRVESFIEIDDELEQNLKVSIEEDIKENEPRTFKLLQSYYKTCIDTDQIEKTSENDFREILKTLGGWPILEGSSWNESSFDWKETVYKLRRTGYSVAYFVDLDVNVDDKNNSRRILALDQASLAINQEFLSKGLNEKVVKAYYKYMLNFAQIFGVDQDQAKKELTDALNFEIALAKISLPKEDRRDYSKLYNLMTVGELDSQYSGVLWSEYINEILKPSTKVDSNEPIIVLVPSFVDSFSKLINETPKRTLANYVMWRVAYSSSTMLGNKIQKAYAEFSASTTGTNVKEARWKECIGYASRDLHLATSALYVRKYFDESAKDNVEEMIENIRKSYKKILLEVDWMDEKTRKAALEKLEYIQPHIAYPDELLDDQKIDGYYKNLEMSPGSFLKSQLNIKLFKSNIQFSKLRKPVNKTEWTSHGKSAIVNAFYDPTENSIQFPAGILQGVFFGNDKPKYLNYGSIGYVMGHEMTHGFDDQGSQYDKNGNLVDWWDPTTKDQYLQRAQCIIQQYGNYTVKEIGLNLNGKNTQGENIADNGGAKEAYFAYNDWEAQNGQEPRLPGLLFTSQQFFWINFANTWCAKYRPELLRSRVITGVHSPSEFRIIGPVSNLPQFSKDFNCPIGSNMNPVKKCTVW